MFEDKIFSLKKLNNLEIIIRKIILQNRYFTDLSNNILVRGATFNKRLKKNIESISTKIAASFSCKTKECLIIS